MFSNYQPSNTNYYAQQQQPQQSSQTASTSYQQYPSYYQQQYQQQYPQQSGNYQQQYSSYSNNQQPSSNAVAYGVQQVPISSSSQSSSGNYYGSSASGAGGTYGVQQPLPAASGTSYSGSGYNGYSGSGSSASGSQGYGNNNNNGYGGSSNSAGAYQQVETNTVCYLEGPFLFDTQYVVVSSCTNGFNTTHIDAPSLHTRNSPICTTVGNTIARISPRAIPIFVSNSSILYLNDYFIDIALTLHPERQFYTVHMEFIQFRCTTRRKNVAYLIMLCVASLSRVSSTLTRGQVSF